MREVAGVFVAPEPEPEPEDEPPAAPRELRFPGSVAIEYGLAQGHLRGVQENMQARSRVAACAVLSRRRGSLISCLNQCE